MSWQDDEIAGPMGYEHCVLFDCARDAMWAYPAPIALPMNICPIVAEAVGTKIFHPVSDTTGLADDVACHLYGYQSPARVADLAIDPLMTGWVRHLKTTSAIVSFGPKKMLSLGYGGAFLTNDTALFEEMNERGCWNERYVQPLLEALDGFVEHIEKRREVVNLWDRYLGDSLIRIPQEQLMPWRVMRRANDKGERDVIVEQLRANWYPVGTNYPPLEGRNVWGDTVLNFFLADMTKWEIRQACEVIKRVADNG